MLVLLVMFRHLKLFPFIYLLMFLLFEPLFHYVFHLTFFEHAMLFPLLSQGKRICKHFSICFTVAFCWDSTTLSALQRDSFPLEDILQLFLSCSVPLNCSWDQHLDERSNSIWHLFGQYTTLYIFVCLKWRSVHLLMWGLFFVVTVNFSKLKELLTFCFAIWTLACSASTCKLLQSDIVHWSSSILCYD